MLLWFLLAINMNRSLLSERGYYMQFTAETEQMKMELNDEEVIAKQNSKI